MTPRQLKGLPTKEMMLCESCHSYHPIEECEVVIIRVIKGKQCEMKQGTAIKAVENKPRIFDQDMAATSGTDTAHISEKRISVGGIEVPPAGYHYKPEEVKPRPSIIPPGLGGVGVMIGPGDANFDAKGDKMVRKV